MSGGDYGRIRHTFWTDPDIKRVLAPEQKALLLYYFTSPHRTLIGLYYCPLEYAAGETGIPLEQVREWTFGALARFVTYDEQTEEIFVHRAGRHQVGDELKEKDNQRKAIEKALSEAHSGRLIRRFLELYEHWAINVEPPPEEAPSKPLPTPFEAKAVAVAVTEHISSKPSTRESAGDGPAAKDAVLEYAKAAGYSPKDMTIANGLDLTAWRTPTGEVVPMSERLRMLQLTDAHLSEPDCKAHNRRSALRYVIATQFDPIVIQAAADRPKRAAETPVNVHADPTTDMDRLREEHPELCAEVLAEFQRYDWWEKSGAAFRDSQVRQAVRERLEQVA